MTGAKAMECVPSREVLTSTISLGKLQLALLEQQYAPTDPIIPNIPQISSSGTEDDIRSDQVTVGDATSVAFSPIGKW
jgi:hypothetical protein